MSSSRRAEWTTGVSAANSSWVSMAVIWAAVRGVAERRTARGGVHRRARRLEKGTQSTEIVDDLMSSREASRELHERSECKGRPTHIFEQRGRRCNKGSRVREPHRWNNIGQKCVTAKSARSSRARSSHLHIASSHRPSRTIVAKRDCRRGKRGVLEAACFAFGGRSRRLISVFHSACVFD